MTQSPSSSLPPPHSSLSSTDAPRISRGAVVSLALGLSSPFLLLLTGVPAVWIGCSALRSINASEGRLRGRRLALAGVSLGVLSCAAVVLGLALIVFVTLRVRSQKVECENNLRRIGGAVLNYHATNNSFPTGTLPNPALPPGQRLSWLSQLPPYLEQKANDAHALQSLHAQLDPALAWDAGPNAAVARAVVPLFRCPGHGSTTPDLLAGTTDYVGFAGVGANAAQLPLDDPMAGFFGYDRTLREKDLTVGATETLMAGETTRDNGPWTAGGPPTVRGLDPADAPYIGRGRAFGGAHPDGLNVLFADGSSAFLREDMSPRFFETLTLLRRDDASPP